MINTGNASYEGWVEFVESQPFGEKIDHTDWDTCTVGEYLKDNVADFEEDVNVLVKDLVERGVLDEGQDNHLLAQSTFYVQCTYFAITALPEHIKFMLEYTGNTFETYGMVQSLLKGA